MTSSPKKVLKITRH